MQHGSEPHCHEVKAILVEGNSLKPHNVLVSQGVHETDLDQEVLGSLVVHVLELHRELFQGNVAHFVVIAAP